MFADMPGGSNRSVLQCVAVCCSVLQCVAVSCRRFVCRHASRRQQEIVAVWRSVLQCVAMRDCCYVCRLHTIRQYRNATHCITLQPTANTATYCTRKQHTATHCNTLQHTATHCNTLQRSRPHGASCLLFCCVGVFPFLFLGMRRKYNECIVPGVSQCFVPLIIDLFLNLIFSKHASRPQRASASPFCGGICVCVLCGQTSCECRDIVAEA